MNKQILIPTARQIAFINNSRELFNVNSKKLNDEFEHNNKHVPMHLRGSIEGNAFSMGKDDWKELDTQSVELQREVLSVFNDLSSISKAMDIALSANEWTNVSDSGSVSVSMDGRDYAKEDQATLEYHITPVPIYNSVASWGWRQKMAIERGMTNIDTSSIMNKQYKIAEALEDAVINGRDDLVFNGQKLYGLRTAPKRLTGDFNINFATSTGEEIREAFVEMVAKFIAQKQFGAVTFYMNYNDWFLLSNRKYSNQWASLTILQEILGIAGVAGIVPASRVPATEVLGIIKSRSVYQVLNGMPLTTIPLARHNLTDDYRIRVMAAASVEFRFDNNGSAGYGQFKATKE